MPYFPPASRDTSSPRNVPVPDARPDDLAATDRGAHDAAAPAAASGLAPAGRAAVSPITAVAPDGRPAGGPVRSGAPERRRRGVRGAQEEGTREVGEMYEGRARDTGSMTVIARGCPGPRGGGSNFF